MNDDTKGKGPTKATTPKQSKLPDARRQLAEMKAKEEELRLEREMEKYAGQDWFVRCRRCNGVAVFLTRHPKGGVIESDMWYSDYRDLDTKYIADHIPCQECAKHQDVHFPRGIRGPWVIQERFVQSMYDIEKRQLKAERERTEHRAMQVAKVSIMEGEG